MFTALERDKVFGSRDVDRFLPLGVQEGHLHDLPQLLDTVLGASDVVVRHVGLVLHGHEAYGRVDLGREGDLDGVLGAVDSYPHALLYVGGRDLLSEADDELSDLLHVYYVLGGIILILCEEPRSEMKRSDELDVVGGVCGLLAISYLPR